MAVVSNHAPAYLIGHFFWTYAITSTRVLKMRWGLDNNVAPREDIIRFGDSAVKAGKITSVQLDTLKRSQASHENTIEQLPFFIGSVLFATIAKVSNEDINRVCLIYTAARIAYHVAYRMITSNELAVLRTIAWWTGNLSCLWLLWQTKTALAYNA